MSMEEQDRNVKHRSLEVFMNKFEDIIKLFPSSGKKNNGISENKIALTEKKLNIKIPEKLRDYYLLFGNNKKFNINDRIFKVKDICIFDEKYLVFGGNIHSDLYGINIDEIKMNNPPVYKRIFKKNESHEFIPEWISWEKNIADFLFRIMIDSLLDGGFKYRFALEDKLDIIPPKLKPVEIIKQYVDELYEKREIQNISLKRSPFEWKYFIDNSNKYIMCITYEDGKIFFIKFGTEYKDIYKKMSSDFIKRNIDIEKKQSNFSKDYVISNVYFYGPTVEFYPGEFIFNKARYINGDLYKPMGSIFMHENAVDKFHDLLRMVNKEFDMYGISTYYNKEQTAVFLCELEKRLYEMKTNKNFLFNPFRDFYKKRYGEEYKYYYNRHNVDFRRYRKQIIKVFEELIVWIKNLEEKELSVLGI